MTAADLMQEPTAYPASTSLAASNTGITSIRSPYARMIHDEWFREYVLDAYDAYNAQLEWDYREYVDDL